MTWRRRGAFARVATAGGFFKQHRLGPGVRRVLAASTLLLGAIRPVAAQVPPDADWATLETDHFRVTFPSGLESLARRAGARAERAWAALAEAFVEPPSGTIDILLTDHTDVSNGFAQVRPSNRITVFARPPADDLGLGYFDDWMELVVTHELAHVFHLDRAGPLGRFLRGIFGRVPAPWPFFPNTGLPRWTTEGLATWYESRFTGAGRVHGTYHEMIVRTAVLEGAFSDLDEASGDSPIWPGGTRAYAYGSLFFDHLLDEHGAERLGAFAEAVAGQWVPYRLNAAAEKAFGRSISGEWEQWEREVQAGIDSLRAARAARPAVPEPERLTVGERTALHPAFSPDGSALAWSRADGRSDVQIHVAGSDGTGGRERTRTNGLATFDWLPDGSLLFSQLELQDPYRAYDDLWIADASGGTRRLTRGARLSQPSVGPDGTWAVVVSDTLGTNALVRLDLSTGEPATLAAADPDVHWSFPSVSPDGRWVAASRWRPGAYTDVVVLDAATGHEVLRVTDDRALDLAAAWAPDGRWLLWTSDRTGIPNVLAAEVDPARGWAGAPRMVTDVLTGAGYPSADPSGRWVVFSGYHATGWDVERTPFAPEAWPRAPGPDPRFRAAPRPRASQEAAVEGEVRDYDPLPTLAPTYWEPLVREAVRTSTVRTQELVVPGREVLGPSVGFRTSGHDLVGRHAWEAFTRVFTSTNAGRADAGGAYSFAGLGNPVLSVGGGQFWDDDGVRLGRREDGAPLDTLFVLERDRNVSAAVTLLYPRWRRHVSLTLSGGLAWEHRELLDNALEPSQDYRLTRSESRFGDFRATLSYSSTRTFGYQLGAAQGTSVFVRARHRPELGLPDSLAARPAEDGSVDDLLGQIRTFRALGGPGFASHVLGLRASAGVARGPGADAGHFEVGGASGARESLTGLALFGGTPLFFPVRGYPEAARFGRYAWTASAEYRLPLGVVDEGLGAWPLHVDRVFGHVFADAGNAWGPELGIHGFENPRRASLASAGAELVAGVLALWAVPLDVRVGVAVPLVESAGAVFYTRLGLSF